MNELDMRIQRERRKRALTAQKARSGYRFRNPAQAAQLANPSRLDQTRTRAKVSSAKKKVAGRKSPFAQQKAPQ